MSVALRAASMFAGVGGLDLGLQLVVPGARTVLYIERDSYSAAALVARMEDSSLDRAPVWDDIATFDGKPWRGSVDLIMGGFPCQDISVAGKGAGIEGKRSGLFYELMRVVDEVRPRYVFLENVSGIIGRGLDAVLARLAESGFNAEWLCLRASGVGAPHRRERWFCLACADGDRSPPRGPVGEERTDGGCTRGESGAHECPEATREGVPLAYRDPDGCERERSGGLLDGKRASQRHDVDGCDDAVADARHVQPEEPQGADSISRQRSQEWRREFVAAGTRTGCRDSHGDRADGNAGNAATTVDTRSLGVFPPGPTDHDAWRDILNHHPHLAPAVESGVRVLVDGLPGLVVDASRADQLRCSGNGVVALQAAVAFRELVRRVGVIL